MRTPDGKDITRREYLKRAKRTPRPCVRGHARCAAWAGGPCPVRMREVAAEVRAIRSLTHPDGAGGEEE